MFKFLKRKKNVKQRKVDSGARFGFDALNPGPCYSCDELSCAKFRIEGEVFVACQVHGYRLMCDTGFVVEVFDEVLVGEMYTALHIDSQILAWPN